MPDAYFGYDILTWLYIIGALCSIIGIPLAIWIYVKTKNKNHKKDGNNQSTQIRHTLLPRHPLDRLNPIPPLPIAINIGPSTEKYIDLGIIEEGIRVTGQIEETADHEFSYYIINEDQRYSLKRGRGTILLAHGEGEVIYRLSFLSGRTIKYWLVINTGDTKTTWNIEGEINFSA